ncbi:MAG: F0F1 ATP synthase subunit delta [Burkholderiales bacterium]|nr:F0F1 ATP synthase subunit delta [Burkholderiales bacterium]
MAELITIARPYAEAAFALARERNALSAWSQMLRLASSVVADPRIAGALDNPKLDTAARESLLLSICGDRLNDEGRNFLRVLIDADRIALMPAIAGQFDALKDDADGVARATIETAFPLADADLAELKTALARRFGRRIEATVVERPELIGGARVTVGDNVIDATISEQLRAMAAQLRA